MIALMLIAVLGVLTLGMILYWGTQHYDTKREDQIAMVKCFVAAGSYFVISLASVFFGFLG